MSSESTKAADYPGVKEGRVAPECGPTDDNCCISGSDVSYYISNGVSVEAAGAGSYG